MLSRGTSEGSEKGNGVVLSERTVPAQRTVRGAGGDVVGDVVVAVDEPVGGGRRVGGEADKELASDGREVARDDVLRLEAVLDKVGVAARLVGDCGKGSRETGLG